MDTQTTEPVRNDSLENPIAGLEPDAPVYGNDAFRAAFTVTGFAAPFVVVVRKSDGKHGSMQFTHSPRYYFAFVAD